MNVMDLLTVKIDALDHQGRGIAHLNQYVIFVFGALVEEMVEIRVTKIKKNIVEAELVRVLKECQNRIEIPCPYFKECGGCDLQHMSDVNQLIYKENKVKEIMKKFAGLEHVVANIVANDTLFSYRNKVVFQVNDKVGFFRKKSNRLIEVETCLLLPQKVNDILSKLDSMNLKNINQVMVRYSEAFQNCMVVFYVSSGFKIDQIPKESFKDTSILVKREDRNELIIGSPFLLEQVGAYTFKISPDSFFQVNTKQMEKLYNTVLEYSGLTGKENVLDLYCGTGTIGIFLSKSANKVLGIEINESAVEDAFWNKKQNHIHNIEFICGDTGTILKQTSFSPDLVVVDPPRAGLDELAISEIKKISAPKLIYVSCDPVTLARDIKRLEQNYEVNIIIPIDMFPNTYHVECVCVLNRC